MDLLETWLEEVAELSGPRLAAAIHACTLGMVYTVKDLLKLSEMPEQFKETLPQGLLRGMILTALEREKDNIKEQTEKVPTVSCSLPQTEQQTQSQRSATKNTDHTALQLPPDKLYHFFASHKVRSIFELRVFCSL